MDRALTEEPEMSLAAIMDLSLAFDHLQIASVEVRLKA